MTTGTDALFCSVCSGYVHPFLDACPTCGAPHPSRFDEALRGQPLGLASLPGDPDLRSRAALRARTNTLVTSRRFAIMSGGPEVEGDEQADLPELLNEVTGAFQYRTWFAALDGARPDAATSADPRTGAGLPAGRTEPVEARLVTESDRLLLKPVRGGDPIEIALATIRSVGILRGTVPVALAAQRPRGAEVVLTASSPEGQQLLYIGNPGSLFATKARSDHFGILAWWLGVIAGVTAERRWMALGPARHASELGLRAGGSGEPVAGAPGPGADALRPSIEALDRLRDAGVLTPAEYEAKLRELRSRAAATGSPRDRA